MLFRSAPKRGTVFGCGMSTIALGEGVVGISEVHEALVKAGFNGATTLEIAGEDNILNSKAFLEKQA